MTNWTDEDERDPVIVCAACRLPNGLIVCGARHWDMTMRNIMDSIVKGWDEKDIREAYQKADQGFIDQFGIFYNRVDARKIAEKNKQLIDRASDSTLLCSEDIY